MTACSRASAWLTAVSVKDKANVNPFNNDLISTLDGTRRRAGRRGGSQRTGHRFRLALIREGGGGLGHRLGPDHVAHLDDVGMVSAEGRDGRRMTRGFLPSPTIQTTRRYAAAVPQAMARQGERLLWTRSTVGRRQRVVFSKRKDYQHFANAKTALSTRKSLVLSLIAPRLHEKQNAQQMYV